MADTPPDILVADANLTESGFTVAGLNRYKTAVTGYAIDLFERAVMYGEAGKDKELPREVTHEHVRTAASAISNHPKISRSNWSIVAQIAEYVSTAVAGAGVGHMDTNIGLAAFILGTAVAVILLSYRLAHRQN